MNGPLDWVCDTLAGSPASSPSAVSFLIRQYLLTGRLDLRDTLESALASAIVVGGAEQDVCLRVRWTALYAEASALTDDGWMADLVRDRTPRAVDALESLVRRLYEPGEGLAGVDVAGHAQCAVSLLDAYSLSGRLPYSMLADELYRTVLRPRIAGVVAAGGDGAYAAACVAAVVACRLAALYRDDDYRKQVAAAGEPGVDYPADADALLESMAGTYREHPDAAADYGLALLERFALSAHPN